MAVVAGSTRFISYFLYIVWESSVMACVDGWINEYSSMLNIKVLGFLCAFLRKRHGSALLCSALIRSS